MAFIDETIAADYSIVDDKVYQIETTDFVEGGEGGTANKQAKTLAKRTNWLWQKIVELFTKKADKDYVDLRFNDLGVQIDAAKNGLTFKDDCRVVLVNDVELTGLLTVDGVVLVAGDRVLVAIANGHVKNGIYLVKTTAWERATDANTATKLKPNTTIWVAEGVAFKDTQWTMTNDTLTLGTTALLFVQSQRLFKIEGANVLQDASNRLVSDAEKTTWNGKVDKYDLVESKNFTPKLYVGADYTGTYVAQKGTYSKIGNVVTIYVYIRLGTLANYAITYDAYITNLPFPIKSGNYSAFSIYTNSIKSHSLVNYTTITEGCFTCYGSGTSLFVIQNNIGGVSRNIKFAALAENSEIIISGTYIID